MTKRSAAIEARVSSKSKEWYSPAWVIEKVYEVMGGIELDPASCAKANEVVKAKLYFGNGALEKTWDVFDWFITYGFPKPAGRRVFLNPPYGWINGKSSAALFYNKMETEFALGHFDEGIILINANIGDEWYIPAFKRPICFVERRIKFWCPDGTFTSPTHGNSLIYFGNNEHYFEYVMDKQRNPEGGIGYVRMPKERFT